MITFMRRYRRTLQVGLLVVIAAFVASLFIFGSQSMDTGAARDSIAVVNGEAVPIERYQRRYQEFAGMYAQMLRDRFTPEMLEQFGLRQQVADDLVNETLAVQRARAEGLAVSDEELNAHIHTFQAFHEDGRFTLRRYEETLRRIGYTTTGFEDDMRRRLTRQKIERTVRSGVKVSDAEVEQAYVQQREEARAAWALVEVQALMAQVQAGDEELETYLKEHGGEFRQPERRRVQYVALDPRGFRTAVTDAEVEKYYAEHTAEFETPQQARAAHVLARVGETGGSEAEDKARAKAAGAIARVKAGEDFAKVAREMSEDPGSAQRGGDLDWVSKGELVPQFEQALFALKKGEVTAEPVRTPFGFHAIKVFDVRPATRKPLKEVGPQIREKLAGEASEKAARARAEEVRAKLMGAADFMAEAKALGLAPLETTIARRQPGPFVPPDTMEESAFNLAPAGVSTVVKTPAGFVVMRHVASLPAAVPPLAEIKAQVSIAVRRQKAEAIALEKATQLANEARTQDLEAAARKAGAQTGTTTSFSRSKPAERLPGNVMLKALESAPGTVSDPVKAQQGYYVVKVLERVPPDMSGLAAEKDRITRELTARKQNQAWESWISAARGKAKIEMSSRLPGARG
jgi:peptidyl-prolyl cis-trans isomerase D